MPRQPTILMLQDLSSNKLGGTEEYTLAFGRAIAARGGRLVVAVRALEDTWRAALAELGAGIETIRPQLGKRQFAGALHRLVRRVQPDVTIMNFFAPIHPIPVILRNAGARRIIFVDDLSGGVGSRSPLRGAAAKLVARRSMAPCARIVGVSQFVADRDRARYGLPARKVVCVYNGVHTRVPGAEAVAQLRADFDLGDAPVVLGLGHFVEAKGFHHLIDAFAGCLGEFPDAILMLVGAPPEGENPYADRLRRKLEPLPAANVRLVGVRSDARTFMAASAVVAVPSQWEEAFGFVVAEGMMSGAAVIASRAGGIPELIEDGEDGVLVQRDDAADLQLKLRALLADPALRARLGVNAARVARARFSVDRMVADMVQQVDDVAPGLLSPTSARPPA